MKWLKSAKIDSKNISAYLPLQVQYCFKLNFPVNYTRHSINKLCWYIVNIFVVYSTFVLYFSFIKPLAARLNASFTTLTWDPVKPFPTFLEFEYISAFEVNKF